MTQTPASPVSMDDVYVVIPAFNESTVIADVLADVAAVVDRRRVILVDDASSDATAAVAHAFGSRVVRHSINRGQGAALATGIAYAVRLGAGVIVTFDADGQHRAADIPLMVKPILDGEVEVVLGSRFLPDSVVEIPPMRRLILKAAVLFTRVISQINVSDTHNGYRALSGNAAQKIRIRQDRMEHASEILDEIRARKLSYVERPVRIQYSQYSLAKGQRNRDAFKLLFRVLLNKVAR